MSTGWIAACLLGVALVLVMALSLARSAARADRAAERWRDRDALIDGVFPPTRAEGDDVP